jgi:hypothetical protein
MYYIWKALLSPNWISNRKQKEIIKIIIIFKKKEKEEKKGKKPKWKRWKKII